MLAWRRVRVVLFCLLRFALELFDGFFQLRDLLAEFLGFRQFIGQTTGIAVLGAGGRSKPVGDSVQGAREILALPSGLSGTLLCGLLTVLMIARLPQRLRGLPHALADPLPFEIPRGITGKVLRYELK